MSAGLRPAERGSWRARVALRPGRGRADPSRGCRMQRHVARFAVLRYGVAILSVAVAGLLALWLRPLVLASAQMLLVAILIAGWVGGLGPALVASALATLALDYSFTLPFDSLKLHLATPPRLVIFAIVALFTATMSAARSRAEYSLIAARDELEARVQQRTAELERSNERLQAAVTAAVADRPQWFLESMDRVNRAIQGTNDLEQMMSDVLDATLAIFECDRVWLLYPCDPEAPSHCVKMEQTRPEFPGPYRLGEELPADPTTATLFRLVRASRDPVPFGPDTNPPLPVEMATRLGIKSRLLMAVHPKGDQPYMFGLSQCARSRVWTPLEGVLFQNIGQRLADALTSL